MTRAILFDLDGTLADTLTDIADAVNAVLAENGLPTHPIENYRTFIGNGAKVLVRQASGIAEEERLEPLFRAFLAEYDRRCLDKVAPYDGVTQTLDALRAQGFLLGVVTNKPHAQAEKIVRHLFGDRFGCVYGNQPDCYPRKPDPTVVTLAAASLGAETTACVFVGDSDVDVFTAHNAGIPCIGCAFGFRGEAELLQAGADAIVYSFTELQKNRLIFE